MYKKDVIDHFGTQRAVPNTEELRQNTDRSRSMKSEITIN
ncbi:hypothetical protein ESCOMMO221M2_15785 [Escherichia coli]